LLSKVLGLENSRPRREGVSPGKIKRPQRREEGETVGEKLGDGMDARGLGPSRKRDQVSCGRGRGDKKKKNKKQK